MIFLKWEWRLPVAIYPDYKLLPMVKPGLLLPALPVVTRATTAESKVKRFLALMMPEKYRELRFTAQGSVLPTIIIMLAAAGYFMLSVRVIMLLKRVTLPMMPCQELQSL